jgi:hypothetical protein
MPEDLAIAKTYEFQTYEFRPAQPMKTRFSACESGAVAKSWL